MDILRTKSKETSVKNLHIAIVKKTFSTKWNWVAKMYCSITVSLRALSFVFISVIGLLQFTYQVQCTLQGHHGRFLAGKAVIHSGGYFNCVPLPPPLSHSQNLAKD